MEDCLFCKIAAGQVPSNKLYEDDQLLAFYDIDPQAPIHFLVIPKKHIPSAAALTEEDGGPAGPHLCHHRQAVRGPWLHRRVPHRLQCGRGRGPERQAPALPCDGKAPHGLARRLSRA